MTTNNNDVIQQSIITPPHPTHLEPPKLFTVQALHRPAAHAAKTTTTSHATITTNTTIIIIIITMLYVDTN
jgi:hypothetical protein